MTALFRCSTAWAQYGIIPIDWFDYFICTLRAYLYIKAEVLHLTSFNKADLWGGGKENIASPLQFLFSPAHEVHIFLSFLTLNFMIESNCVIFVDRIQLIGWNDERKKGNPHQPKYMSLSGQCT